MSFVTLTVLLSVCPSVCVLLRLRCIYDTVNDDYDDYDYDYVDVFVDLSIIINLTA